MTHTENVQDPHREDIKAIIKKNKALFGESFTKHLFTQQLLYGDLRMGIQCWTRENTNQYQTTATLCDSCTKGCWGKPPSIESRENFWRKWYLKQDREKWVGFKDTTEDAQREQPRGKAFWKAQHVQKGSFSAWGNGNPLQYSCLENPMDGASW